MNSRERVLAAFGHTQPDRTPVFEYVLLSPLADRILGRPFAGDDARRESLIGEVGWETALRREAADRVDLAVRLGHDMIYCVPVPPPSPPATDSCAVASRSDPVERMRRRNEAATPAADSVPDESFLIYQLVLQEQERRGVDLPLFVPAYGHGIWTDTDLMMTMLMEPEVAQEHFSLATRQSLAFIAKYLQLAIHIIGVGGDFAGNQLLISPQLYREFIVPEVRKVSRRIHDGGGYAINASDGNLWPVLDDFLDGCEVDGYAEIDLHAGMDLGRLKAHCGDRITFLGNLDCGNVLSFAKPDEVRRHVVECLEAGMGNGGHILTASNAITSSVPLENYVAAVNAYREFFGLECYRVG
jgi:hypothetical protein